LIVASGCYLGKNSNSFLKLQPYRVGQVNDLFTSDTIGFVFCYNQGEQRNYLSMYFYEKHIDCYRNDIIGHLGNWLFL